METTRVEDFRVWVFNFLFLLGFRVQGLGFSGLRVGGFRLQGFWHVGFAISGVNPKP